MSGKVERMAGGNQVPINPVLPTSEVAALPKPRVVPQNSGYSIVANGRELNPGGYVLGNEALRENVGKLYVHLVKELGTTAFQFQVTGGDRHGSTKAAYSSTNGSFIGRSGPAHIRGDAVDLRIKYPDGTLVPVEVVKPAVSKTDLIFDPHAMPHHYPDKHYHLQLPRGF